MILGGRGRGNTEMSQVPLLQAKSRILILHRLHSLAFHNALLDTSASEPRQSRQQAAGCTH